MEREVSAYLGRTMADLPATTEEDIFCICNEGTLIYVVFKASL